jgi:hypothetical protein
MTRLLALLVLSALSLVGECPDAGCVNFAQRTGSDFDKYINGGATDQQWITVHFWRMQTSNGWFDKNLSWYKGAWAYIDSYAIYNNSQPLKDQHPEWILRDQNGNKLYIPWGCAGGTCPQFAADVSNPLYRDYWIGQARAIMAKGYKGLWIDDVNLNMQVGDGSGKLVTPMDPNTGRPMASADWARYFADFMTEVRQALPNAELLHNSMWFAGSGLPGSDPYVQQEIKAADYINRESGVSDSGITGNGGYWSIQSLFSFFDTVHSLGSHIDIQEFHTGGYYGLAAYFLISNGGDAIGDGDVTPNNWPAGYDVQLGAALAARYTWSNLIRRDFAKGIVLLNPPGRSTVNVTAPGIYTDLAGNLVSSISLGAKQGIILLGATTPPPPPVIIPPVVPPPPPPVVTPPPPVPSSGTISNGTYVLTNLLSGLVLDDPSASVKAGIQMRQWTPNGTNAQRWQFEKEAGGYFVIQNVASGLFLEDLNGKLVQDWYGNSSAKRWAVQPVTGGYLIVNKATGRVIDDSAMGLKAGNLIITFAKNGGKNQVWAIR